MEVAGRMPQSITGRERNGWMISKLAEDDPAECNSDELTVIFAVPPDPKTPGFDCRETEPDGLSQGGGVYVRNTVLVADTTIRKVESLAGDVAVGVRSVVGGEPRLRGDRASVSETSRPGQKTRAINEIMRTKPEQKSV